jgi:hypothetical protein
MVIEVVEQINCVERRVRSRTFDAGEARTVVIARTYDAELEDVWDACTKTCPGSSSGSLTSAAGGLGSSSRTSLRTTTSTGRSSARAR